MPTTGRWGWYRDHEGRDWRRVSTLVKKVETDNYSLDLWKQRQVLIGAARRDDLITAVKSMGAPDPMTGWTGEQKALQNELVEKASEAAKDSDGAITGTAAHTLTERLDRGEPLEQVAAGLPALLGETVRAYAALRELNGWRTVEIERTVVCDELEVAGTFDRIDRVPGLAALLGPGECQYGHTSRGEPHSIQGDDDELPVVADVKTEAAPWLNGLHIGPQLAIYSRARRMWRLTGGMHDLYRNGKLQTYPSGDPVQVPNGEYVPAPCVRQDVAIVVHLRDGAAVPLFVNLAEGWDAAQAAYAQMNRESSAKRRLGAAGAWFVPVPNVVKPKPAQTLVEHAAAERYADPNRPAAGQVVGVTAWDAAKSAPGATPVGLPAFGVDGSTVASAQLMSDGTTHYAVGDTVSVAGLAFTKHAELPSGADIVGGHGPLPAGDPRDAWCKNCAPVLAGASVTRVDGTQFGTLCVPCGGVDERSASGVDTARPLPAALATAHLDAAQESANLSRKLIEAIWRAVTLDGLAILWNMARDRDVPWTGPVAAAADARRRQIECPQRTMAHVPGTAKCACGWVPAVAP